MSIEKTSAEFEAWFKERFWHECYEDVKHHLFAAWQASRESLVIDLSDLSNCFSPNDCGDWAMWLDDVRILAQRAGLKVKL